MSITAQSTPVPKDTRNFTIPFLLHLFSFFPFSDMRITPFFGYFLNDILQSTKDLLIGKLDSDEDTDEKGQQHTEKYHDDNFTDKKVIINRIIFKKIPLVFLTMPQGGSKRAGVGGSEILVTVGKGWTRRERSFHFQPVRSGWWNNASFQPNS